LDKTCKDSTEVKKQERYNKNKEKQRVADQNYSKSCIELVDFLGQLESRVEVVLK
jgi:hypothetical protein